MLRGVVVSSVTSQQEAPEIFRQRMKVKTRLLNVLKKKNKYVGPKKMYSFFFRKKDEYVRSKIFEK